MLLAASTQRTIGFVILAIVVVGGLAYLYFNIRAARPEVGSEITSWGWSRSQGFGCSPIKVVRELGLERRETVRSLSAVGVGDLRGAAPSTRGPGWTYLWWTSCRASGTAG